MRALITGGAGFIGSHVAEELLDAGYDVRLLDVLDSQVHEGAVPEYLHEDVELIDGDVRDRDALRRALRGVQAVVHLAAAVGVGQSMYQLHRYVDVNSAGTAVLLETLTGSAVERLVVASSMSVYGEGAYARSGDRALLHPPPRSRAQLEKRSWELRDEAGHALHPVPTPEHVAPLPSSPYALTKYDQERMCLMYGAAYGLPTVALRLFNVYGPRQALSNPYTGVMAIFACRLLNGKPPIVFEDGAQKRDFVNVRDVARAFRAALERPQADGHAINVGSASSLTIGDVARMLADVLGREDLEPRLEGKYRAGDIRHCFADVALAGTLLDYEPRVPLRDGIAELADWLARQTAVDRAAVAAAELDRRGLTL